MEIYGIILFFVGASYTAFQLHKDRVALNSDRRALWRRAEELLKTREEETTKRQELSQGFDWSKNLPLIMGFLNGKGIDLDQQEIEKLINEVNIND
jgi:hypothetical protein